MNAEQPIFNELGIGDFTNTHIIGSLSKGSDGTCFIGNEFVTLYTIYPPGKYTIPGLSFIDREWLLQFPSSSTVSLCIYNEDSATMRMSVQIQIYDENNKCIAQWPQPGVPEDEPGGGG